MKKKKTIKKSDPIMHDKVFGLIALVTGGVLLVPLVARFPWTLSDFVVMGVLLFGAGSTFVFLARRFPKNRVAVGAIVLVALLWLWVELAVGLFTNWGS